MVDVFHLDDWLLALPPLILILGGLVIPFVGGGENSKLRSRLAVSTLVASFLSIFWLLSEASWGLYQIRPSLYTNGPAFGALDTDAFSAFFQIIFVGVALLVAAVSTDFLAERRQTPEYWTLLLLATAGMMVVAAARDLLTLFVGVETTAISTFVLAGYRRRNLANAEASTKFFILGALSAALLLYAISLVYAAAGTLSLQDLATNLATGTAARPAILLAVGFFVAAFGFEITIVPFHMWAPDVYHGSPDPVSAFLSGAGKKMGFAAMFKVFFVGLLAVQLQWMPLVGFLAVVTMTVANVAALQQTSLKRLVAWSSIAHAGYILIAFPVGTELGITGGLFQILTHALMAGGAFVLLAMFAARGMGDTLESYRGLHKREPLAALTLTLLMLSLAGVPPLAGFMSKFVLFQSAVEAGVARDNNWILFLAVAGIINSAISLFYYGRVIRSVYLDEPDGIPARMGLPFAPNLALLVVLTLVVLIGVWPTPFLALCRDAAQSLLAAAP